MIRLSNRNLHRIFKYLRDYMISSNPKNMEDGGYDLENLIIALNSLRVRETERYFDAVYKGK